jgi:hypothetical protein
MVRYVRGEDADKRRVASNAGVGMHWRRWRVGNLRELFGQGLPAIQERGQAAAAHRLDDQAVAVAAEDGLGAGEFELRRDMDDLVAIVTEQSDLAWGGVGVGHGSDLFR